MQNDLISRSALIKHLTDWRLQEAPYGICDEETETYKTICECIKAVKEQPTAYSVEDVVAELEEELELAEKEEKRCLMEHSQRYEKAEQYALGISNALDVVRNGGKE